MKKTFFVITVMLMAFAAVFIAGCQSQNDLTGEATCSELKVRLKSLETTYLQAKAGYEAQCSNINAPACIKTDGSNNTYTNININGTISGFRDDKTSFGPRDDY